MMLTVVYVRNESEPDAVENRILNYEDGGFDKQLAVLDALYEVFPNIPKSSLYPTVTRITLKTMDGKLTSAVAEDADEIIPYLPIPSHLSHISTVSITELQKEAVLDMDVDRVEWKGQSFAFKKTGEHLEGTLRELTILDRLCNSPHIIDLKAIVTNKDNRIRGFLMPYIHAGNLSDVFVKARRDPGVSKEDEDLVIDWSLKLTWALQITRGIVELHAIAAYNGDLKPQNVLLGLEGQAILVDFLPMGFSDEFAAPEILARQHDHNTSLQSMLTGAADVYSLGLILYALTQENARGIRIPSWKDGPGSAPCWYRDVVQQCLNLDPAGRPSALEVLSLLQNGAS